MTCTCLSLGYFFIPSILSVSIGDQPPYLILSILLSMCWYYKWLAVCNWLHILNMNMLIAGLDHTTGLMRLLIWIIVWHSSYTMTVRQHRVVRWEAFIKSLEWKLPRTGISRQSNAPCLVCLMWIMKNTLVDQYCDWKCCCSSPQVPAG